MLAMRATWLVPATSLLLFTSIAEAASVTYPFTVRLHLSEETLRARFNPDPFSRGDPAWTIAIGEQTRDAYSDLVRRMFRRVPPNVVPDLQLDVSIARHELRPTLGGWVATVTHLLVLTSPPGIELARWELSGESMTLNEVRESLAAAFERAADQAAGTLEWKFDEPASVKKWVAARGVAPADLRGRLAERAPYVAFLDASAGLISGGDDYNPAFVVRLGAETRWLLAQVSGGRWTSSFVPSPVFGTANGDTRMDTWALGGDLGLVGRLYSKFEGRLGGGAHLLWGTASMTYQPFLGVSLDPRAPRIAFSYHRWAPAAFAAVQYSEMLFGSGVRMRIGLEFRRYFNTAVRFAEFRRTASIAENFFGLFIGTELPGRSGAQHPAGSSKI